MPGPRALPEPLDLARELLAAYNVRDWGLVRASLADDCVYEEVGRPERRLEGAYPIVRLFREWALAVPDSRARILAEVAGDGGAALEVEWLPQADAPAGGAAPAASRRAIRTMLMLSVGRDRVTQLRHCYDAFAAYRALGLGPL